MSYLEIVRGVNTVKLYRTKAVKYLVLVVLCSLLILLGSVQGSSNDWVSIVEDNKSGMEVIEDPECWVESPEMTERLKELIDSTHQGPLNVTVQVKPYIPKEATMPASDTVANLSPTNSTKNITRYMVKWPLPDLKIGKCDWVSGEDLRKSLAALDDIAVIQAKKVSVAYSLCSPMEYQDILYIMSRLINMLECECLEFSLAVLSTTRYKWPTLESRLPETPEKINYVGSNSSYHLILNIRELCQYLPVLKALGIPLLRPIHKLTLIAPKTVFGHYFLTLPLIDEYTLCLNGLHHQGQVDLTALCDQKNRCRKIIIGDNLRGWKLVGLNNTAKCIHPNLTLELYWLQLLYLCESNCCMFLKGHSRFKKGGKKITQ
ncbi:hypothetical protein NEHOM01_1228 [Nematocida homosporus]|uniref:uncharacterized protein n=1 Tax=Nematocida homosporus TaxID=1912981 RepID=UPI00221FF42A|nr:uncharacterized protein NEHOM01_1228 [Nematocida homosporus]KAI5186025.1 hypothetical protein NEHOM01_1228 [Nematocida homosporus]